MRGWAGFRVKGPKGPVIAAGSDTRLQAYDDPGPSASVTAIDLVSQKGKATRMITRKRKRKAGKYEKAGGHV